jgi:hypothetical protein
VPEKIEILVSEISQLREQYTAEVGEGRRVWPRSIKERVEKLDEIGVTAKQVSLQTGIGYDTILQWRYQRRQLLKKQFHQIQVAAPVKAIAKVGTVTVPKAKDVKKILKLGTVTVTTPEGFRIEATDAESIVQILRALRVE